MRFTSGRVDLKKKKLAGSLVDARVQKASKP